MLPDKKIAYLLDNLQMIQAFLFNNKIRIFNK